MNPAALLALWAAALVPAPASTPQTPPAAAPQSAPAATSPSAPAAAPQSAPAAASPSAPAAAQAPAPQAHPIRFKAEVDKQKVSLGETFQLTLEIVHPPADAYALPDPLKLAPLTLRGEPAIRREEAPDGARTVFVLRLADVSSLTPAVPDLTLVVQGPDGLRSFTVPGQKLELESLVAAEGAPNPEHAHHGPKPPVPVLVRSFLWAWLLAGLVLLAAAAFFALRFLRGRKPAAVATPPAPPDAEALGRLASLRRREPWKRGEGRGAIFELSETVRHYLARRLSFAALDLTSEELLRELDRRPLRGLELPELAQELAWQDLVKFARHEPAEAECLDAVGRAEALVRRTAPGEGEGEASSASAASRAAPRGGGEARP